ncbi:hypothetical protein WA026_019090 [Henosepilachna vigintioctopunctata]|uniref:EndoU domain-containing protein n=1 Tax=Henosepilachna vigintioctopunctata TaxID=420089 RepID=A0AAW1VAR8_9CUCU
MSLTSKIVSSCILVILLIIGEHICILTGAAIKLGDDLANHTNSRKWTENYQEWPQLGQTRVQQSGNNFRSQFNTNDRSTQSRDFRLSGQEWPVVGQRQPTTNWNNHQNFNNHATRPHQDSFLQPSIRRENPHLNPNVSFAGSLRNKQLLLKDKNNAAKYVTINFQGRTTSRSKNDEAPLPLLSINNAVYNLPTISKLVPLYDNYILKSDVNEDCTNQEKEEENVLLKTILSTDIMKATRNFLIEKGSIKNDREFENLLHEIWFYPYSRGKRKVGSSGFEHVFLAEIKKNEVSGLHNWLYFEKEESNQRANYLGYLKKIDLGGKGAILKYTFNFHGINKPVGAMFIGTSPEFEMALYSACFILRADKICPLKLNGHRFGIRTYSYSYDGKKLIGSAFPDI